MRKIYLLNSNDMPSSNSLRVKLLYIVHNNKVFAFGTASVLFRHNTQFLLQEY